MPLYSSVYVAPPIPFTGPNGKPGGLWSPIACTLIHTQQHAVLVDTPITNQQTDDLIAFIERTLHPGAKLTYIYITHGHGDHWFGINKLTQRFPGVKILATQGTIRHIRGQIQPKAFNAMWGSRFPNQIDQDFSIVEKIEPLGKSSEFSIPAEEEGGTGAAAIRFQAVEVGHSDTHDTTVLFCPALKLVVAGDVVYGDVHQMLAEANTHALRMEWVRAIETIAALRPTPEIVVPGHMKVEEVPGAWHLERSRKYVLDFDALVEGGTCKNARDLVAKMKQLWPSRFNDGALIIGAMGAFQAKKTGKL